MFVPSMNKGRLAKIRIPIIPTRSPDRRLRVAIQSFNYQLTESLVL
jgi:hypothetical protein